VSRLGRAARGWVWAVFFGTFSFAGGLSGCATAPAVGRGGTVYEVRVDSVNGIHTALRGPLGHPACVVQVAERVATVWLASPAHADRESPVIFEADAEALKDGIVVERSWNVATVHNVTDEELAVGIAVVLLPGAPRPTTIELRFDPVSRLAAHTASTTLPNAARDSSKQ
jgi:hypothetical protein